MNSKNKNIRDLYRGIKEFKRGYQHKSNSVKDEKGDLLAELHNILKCRRATSLSFCIYIGSEMLGRYKYIRLS
jgi:hypothetical protein